MSESVVDLEEARRARYVPPPDEPPAPLSIGEALLILNASIAADHESLARMVFNLSLAFDLIDNLNKRLIAIETRQP